MKKAFDWLAGHGIAYRFHDYRKDGVDAALLRAWCEADGWRALINSRGPTWRKLSPEAQAIAGADEAIALMTAHPALIRRPILITARGERLTGFVPDDYAAVFAGHA
jgi:arsenate reductase